MGLVFLGPYSFAQNEKKINSAIESTSEISEDLDTKKLNKLLIDYNKNQQKILNDSEKNKENAFINPDEIIIEEDVKDNKNQEKIKRKKIKEDDKIDNLKNIKYSEAIKVALAPLQKMSESELSKLLRDNTKNSSSEKLISNYPNIILFSVRLIKDKLAIPNLAKIIDDQKKLIRFTGIMILTFLISFLLKFVLKKSGRSVLKAVSLWFLRFMIMMSIRLGIIIYFFGEELAPTFKIAMHMLFSDSI